MATWAQRRKMTYGSIFLALILIVFGLPLFFHFHKAPTCFDGKKNQNEQGIDCGGKCVQVCSFTAAPLKVLWSRAFLISSGVYSAVAYVENPNATVGTLSVPYIFKIYDDKNVLIYERKGRADIPSKKIIPIFETSIIAGTRLPKRVYFEFTQAPQWKKLQNESAPILVQDILLTDESGRPKLQARLLNQSLDAYDDISVVAIIYDKEDNAIAASRTIVDTLPKDSSVPVSFTWPQPFTALSGRVEIVPSLPLH